MIKKTSLFFISFFLYANLVLAAFPVNGVIDDFNRSDTGPPLSSSWTTFFGSGLKVSSNAALVGASDQTSGDYYNAANYGPNVEAYVTITVIGAGSVDPVRLFFKHDAANVNGYRLDTSSFNNNVRLFRLIGGTATQIGASISQTVTAGDSVGITYIDGTTTIYYKVGAGAWTIIGSVPDALYRSQTGRFGLAIYSFFGDSKLDNFGGGNLPSNANVKVKNVQINGSWESR